MEENYPAGSSGIVEDLSMKGPQAASTTKVNTGVLVTATELIT